VATKVFACEALGYGLDLIDKCLEDWGLDGHCQPDRQTLDEYWLCADEYYG
jgi:hypothetical protein